MVIMPCSVYVTFAMPWVECIAEDALIVRFDQLELNAAADAVCALQASLATYLIETHPHSIASGLGLVNNAQLAGSVTDIVPAYISLTIIVDFPRVLPQHLEPLIKQLVGQVQDAFDNQELSSHHILPCCYSPKCGPDLSSLAASHGLTVDEVIHRHSVKVYRVYAIGFSPGFPYLGYVDERIATPRLDTPRPRVAAGSVGIAGNQTGIYPQATPGGWNIIGLCPTALFFPPQFSITEQVDPKTKPDGGDICRLSTGDRVSFRAIDQKEFLALGGCFDD